VSRQVILVRHAHADWPGYSGRDFDRPLTPRGERDAQAAGTALQAAGHRPAVILASPAQRTLQTAEFIRTALGLDRSQLHTVEDIYNASAPALEQQLRRALASVEGAVMLVAHNPGISDLGRLLSQDGQAPGFAPAEWRVLTLNSG
jgi:phosphohistidine phosphatase